MNEPAVATRVAQADAPPPWRFNFINSIKFWGGGERYVFDLAFGLRAKNFPVRIYGRPGRELLRRTAAAGLESIPLPMRFDYDPSPLLQMGSISEADVFVAVTPRDLKLLRLLAFLYPKAKYFWLLGVCYPENTREYRWLLKNENIRLVAVCDFLKYEILEQLPQAAGRISILPTGVDPPAVDPAAARRSLAEKFHVFPDKLFLGIFSRLVPGKGHSLLFRALEQVKRAGVDFHLWVSNVGERDRLESEAVGLGLGDLVTFTGDQPDVLPWMAGVDVVLLPSEKECFPYVVMEAMALGKTAVASRVGGLPEMVENGVDGILLPPGEADIWAQTIIELARSPRRRAELGRAAKAKVVSRFSQDRMVANFLKIIHADSPVGGA